MATMAERLERKRQLMPQPRVAITTQTAWRALAERLLEWCVEEAPHLPPGEVNAIVEVLIGRVETWAEAGSATTYRAELVEARKTNVAVSVDTIRKIIGEIEHGIGI